MIEAVHTKVPGRGRFRIDGLSGCHRLKESLEAELRSHKEIRSVSANTITGNVLVCFNSDKKHHHIVLLIENFLSNGRPKGRIPRGLRPGKLKGQGSGPRATTVAAPDPSVGFGDKIKKTIADWISTAKGLEFVFWHRVPKSDVIAKLGTSVSGGLPIKLVKERLLRDGPNRLPEVQKRSRWDILVNQFMSLPVGLLGIAAGLACLTGGLLDAAVIMGVVLANGLIGYFTENESERTIQSLKNIVRPFAHVIRKGRAIEVPAEEVVVGDILVLKPGTTVAADSRIVQAHYLTIDESALTGESMPSPKSDRVLTRGILPIGDRINMAYMGTVVTGGEGLAVVVGTGWSTEVGRLKGLLDRTVAPQTPMERQLSQIGDQLVMLSCAVCAIVFLLGFARGYGLLLMLRLSVSLAAAAVPEGLPAAATTTLALGIKRMKKHQVLIRDLDAVETLGTVRTVCLDKTGTITCNHMAALSIHAGLNGYAIENGRVVCIGGNGDPQRCVDLNRLLSIGVLCNETKISNGDNRNRDYLLTGTPTERALIQLATDVGIEPISLRKRHRLLGVNHRSENRLFMSTLHATPGNARLLAVKGSPPEVLAMCSWLAKDGQRIPLRQEQRMLIESENERMATGALRVLGVAYAEGNGCAGACEEKGLTWLGLIGMADPIRAGVKGLIKAFHRAGIETVMVTGDQIATARAVASELDLGQGGAIEILDASRLERANGKTMEVLGKKVHAYARVSPADKLKIVQAIQAARKVVAMTGDGINDGPALKAADVGIAMGHSGTDVAREVADVVLEKDNLETLIMAIQDGRTIHSNIKKSVHFFLSTNLTEIMVMFAAMTAGVGFPLNAMQLLWINIISDIFPGLALSLEAPEPDILEQKPRDAGEPIFTSSDYKRMFLEAGVISSGSLASYAYGLARYGPGGRAASLAFQTLTIGQLLHALSCRSKTRSVFEGRLPPNKWLSLALAGSLGIQMLTLFVPGLRRFLGLTPLSFLDMAVIAGASLFSLVANEMTKPSGKRTDLAVGKEASLLPPAELETIRHGPDSHLVSETRLVEAEAVGA